MQIEIGNNDLNPWLPGNGSFGLYNWRQNVVPGNPLPWNAPFTNGAKYGHCVELEQGSATVNGTLRSGSDLSLNNATNTITAGDTDARVAQIQWLIQSSYRAAAVNGPNFQNGVEPGAHQSAIWKITNPNDAANDIGTGTAARAAADALADQLLAAAQTPANYGALDQSTWSLSIQGGNGASCTGTTRTVQVKGSPNTVAHLTITAGTAHFPNGTQETDVILGADGTGSVDLVDDGTTADTVTISASLPSWILAQADNGSNQDFAYLENGGNVTKQVSVSFQPCNELQAALGLQDRRPAVHAQLHVDDQEGRRPHDRQHDRQDGGVHVHAGRHAQQRHRCRLRAQRHDPHREPERVGHRGDDRRQPRAVRHRRVDRRRPELARGERAAGGERRQRRDRHQLHLRPR